MLARELVGEAALLLVSNPVFGLDFAAVAEIHGRFMAARNCSAAVLLVSEDLDELLLLSDRIEVMSVGRIVHDVPANDCGYDCLLVEDGTESCFPDVKAATLAMITAQGGIVGWVTPAASVIAVLTR